jgi:intergrase/recombinase
MRIFGGLTVGQQHHLNRAMRAWFKFLELSLRAPNYWLNVFRKAIPKDEMGVDLKVPAEEEIVSDLGKLQGADFRYQAIYNVLLDSGLRLVEAIRLVNEIEHKQVEHLTGFCCIGLGYFRKTKQAYFAFLSDYTLGLLPSLKVKERSATKYYQNHELTNPKYLRKFANDTMTNEELNIPESIADFIEGRVPKTVGARHYMQLKRKAIQFYPRYAAYIKKTEEKGWLNPSLSIPFFLFHNCCLITTLNLAE